MIRSHIAPEDGVRSASLRMWCIWTGPSAPQTAHRLQDAPEVWAASPATAAALIDQGLAAERVSVVPSPVLPAPLGLGGEGVLAVLPVHEPPAASAVIRALQALPQSTGVRLLPTVSTRHLARDQEK